MTNTDRSNDTLLTLDGLAEMLGLSSRTVQNKVSQGNLPSGFKLGSGTNSPRRWWKSDIVAYLQELEVSNDQ